MNDVLKRWSAVASLAGLYFLTAKLGIELSVAQGVVTPVWIPTGLSLAALLLFGYRMWPGIALGAFAANVTSDVELWVAAVIAVGNTLEAVAGAYLLKRARFDRRLTTVRDVLLLVVLGGAVGTTIAASNGTLALWIGGEIVGADVASRWSLWWFGDAMGALLVAPFLLVVPEVRALRSRALEAALLVAAVVAGSSYVFVGGNWRYPYLLFPLLIWAGLRFKQIGVTTAILLISAISITATVRGSVPIGGATETESVQLLQGLLAIVAISLYVLAATLRERDDVVRKLEVAASNLGEAQALAHLGSWEWDITNDTVEWSDEMYRIYGYEPGEFTVTFDSAMERVAEEDRDQIRTNVTNAFATDGVGALVEYRIERPDGSRILRGKGLVELGPDGKPVRMVGTVQDITEEIDLQREVRRLREAEIRQGQALQLNDTIVQGLAAAKTALDLGLHDKQREYLESTLDRARRIVGELLGDPLEELRAGDFVREEPARVVDAPEA
ncbi:MAG: MASE1 domain-containing protein [Actinomycetota bacterium]